VNWTAWKTIGCLCVSQSGRTKKYDPSSCPWSSCCC
jgi:hypothetical protein